MITLPLPDVGAVQSFFETLYPQPPYDDWLVVSWIDAGKEFLSQWFKTPLPDQAYNFIAEKAQTNNVYFGVGLRLPSCEPDEKKRGLSADVSVIPGFFVEFDHNAGVHTAKNLPTPQELLEFIDELPFRFSLIIDSTGGYHCYSLFKEAWVLDTPDEHQRAALLMRRFQRTVQGCAAERGWKVDSTADLARVLRPAGTLNHKSGTPKPVTILHEDAIRYNPSDIENAPWLAVIEDTFTATFPHDGDSTPARLDLILKGCSWIRHCQVDATTLPEPEWYAMLGVVGRCADGEQTAHEWSASYPGYSKEETARKLQHALNDKGPMTCSTIRFDLGGDDYCKNCQHWNRVKSPIVLGRPVTWGQQAPEDAESPPERDVDEPMPEEPAAHRQRPRHAQAEQPDEASDEEPEPLRRPVEPAKPYPVDALGTVLAPMARALMASIQAPDAICAQSVLAAATLAVQGYRDVGMDGRRFPVSIYCLDIGESGERRSAVDRVALFPHFRYERSLLAQHTRDTASYVNAMEAWRKARDEALKTKGGASLKQLALEAVGPEPDAPLDPILLTEGNYPGTPIVAKQGPFSL